MSEQATAVVAPTTTGTPTTKAPEVKQPEGLEQNKSPEQKTEAKTGEGEVKKEANPEDPNKPFLLKVDGKEIHLSKEEAIRWAQKGMGADKKFNEAHKMRQEAEAFIRALRDNPESVLMNPKIMGQERFRKLAQDFLHKEIQKEMMTPQERELAETKEKLAEQERLIKESEQKQHDERQQQLVEHYNKQYEKDITDTLATAGLPKTRGTVKRISYYMSEGLKRGIELKAADVIDLVREDYNKEINELYGQLDGEKLSQFIGEENLKKIREAELKKIRSGESKPNEPLPPTSSKEPKKMSKEEWREMMDNKFGKI